MTLPKIQGVAGRGGGMVIYKAAQISRRQPSALLKFYSLSPSTLQQQCGTFPAFY